jgi:NAD(P)-dependent dehydrogenase (short-subunit alcohol dehydrogenase family)
MKKVIVITGASSGFGELTARELATAGHVVYASMRETTGRNAPQVEAAKKFAAENKVDLRSIELDVASQESVDVAIQRIVNENGHLDVVIHNAGHMVFGPAEAFTPEQLAELYDINVLSTQRVNRAALPVLRQQGKGLVLWVSSTSTRGGTPPYLAPYFAAKAGMEALAVSYAGELARWNIETTIIVPGAFTSGTNHFAHAGSPEDKARWKEYESGPTANLAKEIMKGFDLTAAPDTDVLDVAKAIVKIVVNALRYTTVPSAHRSCPGRSRNRQWCCRPCPRGTVTQHEACGSSQAVVNESSGSESFVKPALNVSARREIRLVTESI